MRRALDERRDHVPERRERAVDVDGLRQPIARRARLTLPLAAREVDEVELADADVGRAIEPNGLGLNDDGEEVIGLFGARDEQFARRALYFSTFEEMLFQMNGLNISNLFGEGSEVLG